MSNLSLQEAIEKWKINKGLLASKLEMPLGTFCNKLSPKHPTKFSDAETVKLKGVLIEMSNELDSITDIDFNAALTVIIK